MATISATLKHWRLDKERSLQHAGGMSKPGRQWLMIYLRNKQAAVVCAQRRILKTKQEHNLQKVLSFSQSNKYAIVSIFRWLSPSLPPWALWYLSLFPLLSPLPPLSHPPYPFCQHKLTSVFWPCGLTCTPPLMYCTKEEEEKKTHTPKSPAPSWNNVRHNLARKQSWEHF